MDATLIRNGRVITPTCTLNSGSILIKDGKINKVLEYDPQQFNGMVIDAQGMYIAPGFIDIHIHGGGGLDFTGSSSENYAKITKFYASRGVTGMLVTLGALEVNEIIANLVSIRQWMGQKNNPGSRVLGVHLEGPFLNAEQLGAQPPGKILAYPEEKDLDWILSNKDIIREITLAPELPGSIDLIGELSKEGIVISAGHSQACEKDILAAIEVGLTHTTHIYSCMSTIVRQGPWRVPGLLECALAFDELSTEMIADLKHIPPPLMRLVMKCKSLENFCLVSDAVLGTGLPDGSEYDHWGHKVIIEDGVAMLIDRTAFAGSVTSLDKMVKNVIHSLNLTVEQAVQLASINPAKIVNLHGILGSIEPGKDADLIVFDDNIHVHKTVIGGKLVFSTT